MLEQLRFSIASQLPPDWYHETKFRDVADQVTFIVETITRGREIVDEQERVTVPATAWDAVKTLLNERFGWRLKVQGREVVTKRVYHVCPHVGGEWKDHIRYVCLDGRRTPESRATEYIRHLLDQPMGYFESAESRLDQIRQLFHDAKREGQ